MSAVNLEPRAVLELLATKVEQYLTSGRQEDLLRIEMAEAVTEAWMVLRPNEPPPWRFDVPEVPEHVTALKDVEGYVWVRVAECWQAADDPATEFDTFHGLVRFVEMTSLVQCPDPRAAS